MQRLDAYEQFLRRARDSRQPPLFGTVLGACGGAKSALLCALARDHARAYEHAGVFWFGLPPLVHAIPRLEPQRAPFDLAALQRVVQRQRAALEARGRAGPVLLVLDLDAPHALAEGLVELLERLLIYRHALELHVLVALPELAPLRCSEHVFQAVNFIVADRALYLQQSDDEMDDDERAFMRALPECETRRFYYGQFCESAALHADDIFYHEVRVPARAPERAAAAPLEALQTPCMGVLELQGRRFEVELLGSSGCSDLFFLRAHGPLAAASYVHPDLVDAEKSCAADGDWTLLPGAEDPEAPQK